MILDHIKTIDTTTLTTLADELCSYIHDRKKLIDLIGTVYETNGYGSYWVKTDNQLIGNVCVSGEQNLMTHFMIYANIKIEEFIRVYQEYRNVYVPYDDENLIVVSCNNYSFSCLIQNSHLNRIAINFKVK